MSAMNASTRVHSQIIGAALGLLLLGVCAETVFAQGRDRTVPSRRYELAFRPFEDGEFRDAVKVFLGEARGALKNAETRWIDSICYYTMCGECYYQMGMLNEAMDNYTAALTLYCRFPDWMTLVKFPISVRPASAGQIEAIPWGTSGRKRAVGVFPRSMLISQGQVNNMEKLKTGGVWQQALLFPVNATEIVRCTTLAIRRRTELMGPSCQHDPLTKRLVSCLSARPGLPNHWSEAWIDLKLGLALVAAGKKDQAVPHLQRSLLAAGRYDHPLTGVGLFELGLLAMERRDYKTAEKFFTEATFAAAQFYDAGLLEEAFRKGTEAHILANEKGVYPPLPAAQAWAKTKRIRWLLASLSLDLGENAVEQDRPRDAAGFIKNARLAIGNREMAAGRIGSRLNYLASAVLYAEGKTGEADDALARSMEFMRSGSIWRFRIALADRLYTGGTLNTAGGVTARTAIELFDTLLPAPSATDWYERPMESMAVLLFPEADAMEHWFETALARKEPEKALQIADRIRRRRFFQTLPSGGRLQSLRYLMSAPDAALDNEAKIHRQDAMTRFPEYAKLAAAEKPVREALAKLPIATDDQEVALRQKRALVELGALGAAQEKLLRQMAVRRVPCDMRFPPIRDTRKIQESLPPGHVVLAFFVTRRHVYAFLLNNNRYEYWQVGSPQALRKRVADDLRELGHFGENAEMTVEQLAKDAWKERSEKFVDGLTDDSPADLGGSFKELVVIPDDVLWYVPFEMLHVKTDDGPKPLIERCNIRYAPMLGLAVATDPPRPAMNTVIEAGRLFPRESENVAREVAAAMQEDIPGAAVLGNPLSAPASLLSTLFDRLVVLDDVPVGDAPYGWPPLPMVRGKPGSTLGSWLPLPAGGPRTVVLPGYHTAAENALKTAGAAPGQEVFLSLCALAQNGAETVLLSRWRTGGLNAYQFTAEFVEALESMPPAEAYRETVLRMRGEDFEVAFEPRVRKSKENSAKADHPFFWAAYMLVDRGRIPEAPAAGEPDDRDASGTKSDAKNPPPAADPKAEEPKSEKPKADATPQPGDAKPDEPGRSEAEDTPGSEPAEK